MKSKYRAKELTSAQYVADRSRFGPTSDSDGKMQEGNVLIGGNATVAKQAPNQEETAVS